MNKTELISAIAEKTEFTKKDSQKSLDAILSCIEDAMSGGESVQLIGFGTFEVRERKSRQGRNPRKPEEMIEIPASKAPAFKPGKGLKDAVNK